MREDVVVESSVATCCCMGVANSIWGLFAAFIVIDRDWKALLGQMSTKKTTAMPSIVPLSVEIGPAAGNQNGKFDTRFNVATLHSLLLWIMRQLDLGTYFFLTVFAFGALNIVYNIDNVEQLATSVVHQSLQDSKQVVSESREDSPPTKLAGLDCTRYGGPPDASEMVYWQDIPEDNKHVSPLHRSEFEYLTFEPDAGGWNNIRMAMETVLAVAFSMGRTLVLPPSKEFYLLRKGSKRHFSFSDFFHMQAIHDEHAGLNIITMEEYLEKEYGNFRTKDGQPSHPPGNITNWDGKQNVKDLFQWLRSVSHVTLWNPENCLAAFPATAEEKDVEFLKDLEKSVLQSDPKPKFEDFVGKPVNVDAPAADRLRENAAGREELCIYNEEMQNARHMHYPCDHSMDIRLLVHFYAFAFYQDWKQDLWMKRFVRDHVRYTDEIQCAAARVIKAVREFAVKETGSEQFNSFHVRRGDFQYKVTRVEADVLLSQAQKKIKEGSVIFMATDERNKDFFQPLKDKYKVIFLDDYMHLLQDVNTNYFGMVDQLVASRGRVFFGCWFSTFTVSRIGKDTAIADMLQGYINRIRGYHASNAKTTGYEDGIVRDTWYYALPDRIDHMQTFYPVKKSFYAREFPTSWRLLDVTSGAPGSAQ